MASGRNEPCPCGSGRKYKRCCLERVESARRLGHECERIAWSLGERAEELEPGAFWQAFTELYGEPEMFGLYGPEPEEMLEADLWIVCDRDLGAGGSPLARARRQAERPEVALEALASSRIRPWRIEGEPAGLTFPARCAISDEPATLEALRPPAGTPAPGRILVARSVALNDGNWALLGGAPVIDPRSQADFSALLDELIGRTPDLDATLAVRGGALLRAAWAWPEEREHTREGELVQSHHLILAAPHAGALIAALGSDPEMGEREVDEVEGIESFMWARSVGSAREVKAEPGVAWVLCEEDRAEPPKLASVLVDHEEGDVSLWTLTERRMSEAERELRSRFGSLLGEEIDRGVDLPERRPRWQRERIERMLGPDVAGLFAADGANQAGRRAA